MTTKHNLETLRAIRDAARDKVKAAEAAHKSTSEYKAWIKANDELVAALAAISRATHNL